jgi:uncharacterized protein (TIGR03790 family)
MLSPQRILAFCLFLLFSATLFSQTAENIILVVNESSPLSMDIGMYYAHKRGIEKTNILRIKTTCEDSISREDFSRQIESPLTTWLARDSAQDRILYIVLTKGIPLRVNGDSGPDGTVASVDSELTLLYRKMLGKSIPTKGPVKNPYFFGNSAATQARQFSHQDQDIYLVCRLDGYNENDIKALIDRGSAPSRDGKILLDSKESLSDKGNIWLKQASELLGQMGLQDRVIFENSGKVLAQEKNVLGYYSWGSNDPEIRVRHFGFEFVPGALAGMFVSTDGRTFSEPYPNWTIGTWGDKAGYFADSPQSLAGDLIREGVTGIAGHIAEPYLEATIHPNILFPAYFSGLNLAESYYLAMPYLSWQTVVVGDPLCAPFRTKSLSAAEIDKGIDPGTELPVIFSNRRYSALMASASRQPGQPGVVKLMLRSEARLAKQDIAGARLALEEAVALDDRIASIQFALASLYEQEQRYDKAIERYQHLLKLAPDNPLVLNNLAYALAVRKNAVEEAIPFAEKAYKLAKTNPNITDTLGWIYHLAGQNDKAFKLLREAAGSDIQDADIFLHLAIVSVNSGDPGSSETALKRALNIDPKLQESAEVKRLRSDLNKVQGHE